MKISLKDNDLMRRFKFYGFGVLLGLLAVSVIYKGKGCKMPGSLKMEELAAQKLSYTSTGECIMQCRNITEEEIKQVLKGGKVNYDKSDVHAKPYPIYDVEGKTVTGKELSIIIADIDTTSSMISAVDLKQTIDTCKCN